MTNLENIDWAHLPFGYMKTDYNVRCTFKDGKWGEIEVTQDETVNLHMAASCLHYGQEIFEGLKAFRGKDGKIRLFRPDENAKRLQNSARGILMEPLPEDIFMEMCKKVVKLNERFIPPYGSGSSLYLRPLEIGTAARVGVSPADEYMVIIFVTPLARTSRRASIALRLPFTASMTALPPVALAAGRWVVTMQPVWALPLVPRLPVIAQPCSSILRRRNISTSVVPPTSLS